MTAVQVQAKKHVQHRTKNDLSEDTRSQMVAVLNANLANGIDLVAQAKQAHWNVKGNTFIQLHELFDTVHDEATGWVDMIAERAVQLGGAAQGTIQKAVAHTTLPTYPADITAGADHVNALSGALSAFGKTVREAIDVAEKAGDAGTADLFTEVSRAADKLLWFVEAHNQG